MNPGKEAPKLERDECQTTSFEQAHAFLQGLYARHEPSRLHEASFRFHARTVGESRFTVDRIKHGAGVNIRSSPYGQLVVMQLFDGDGSASSGRSELDFGPGDVTLLDPELPNRIGWNRLDTVNVRLELEAARQLASELTGLAPAMIRFELSRPIDGRRQSHWSSALRHVREVLANPGVADSPLVREQAFRTLVTALLTTFPNQAVERAVEGSCDQALPAVVRRARVFMDTHAASEITLSQIADAARTGPRTLQTAFRRHLGLTPFGYLRLVRLAGAHEELQAADPTAGASVDAIAARWGFGHAGHFAAIYRQQYGKAPRMTLHS